MISFQRVNLVELTLGGYLGLGAASDEIIMFDTNTEEWKVFGKMTYGRSYHAVSMVNVDDYISFCI